MANAAIVYNSVGEIGLPKFDVTLIKFTVTATATVYATASGGLPIDLTALLNQAGAAFSQPYLNPYNVVDVLTTEFSTGGFWPADFSFNPATVTYNTNPPYPWQGQTSPSVRPDQIVATAPATIRLRAIGASAANHAPFGEVADGAVTDAFTVYLMITKGGTNS